MRFLKKLCQFLKENQLVLYLKNSFNEKQTMLNESNLKKKDKQKAPEIYLTQEQYDECLQKWPILRTFIIKSQNSEEVSFYIESLRKLSSYRDKNGESEMPHACTNYLKEIKKNNKKNKILGTKNKSTESKKIFKEKTQDIAGSSLVIEEKIQDIAGSSLVIEEKTQDIAGSSLVVKEIDPQERKSPWRWRRVYGAHVGSSHLKCDPPMPCQDSVLGNLIPRPMIFVSDGAGSAKLSHLGSNDVTRYLYRFASSIEVFTQSLLDSELESNLSLGLYANLFTKYSVQILEELSQKENKPIDFFRCTLLMVIYGKYRTFWLKIGDGFIVIEEDQKLRLIGPLGKGEFANQTVFLGMELKEDSIHYGLENSEKITGIIACTDGAGEKLVSNDGLVISKSLSKILQKIREGEYDKRDLTDFLSNPKFWIGTTGDDKGISILSKLN